MRANCLKLRETIDNVHSERIAIDLILDRKLHRCVDVATFFVPSNVKVLMIGTVIRESMDQPRVTMEIEYDGFIYGKETIEIAITQTMRVLAVRLQLEQVNH